MPWHDPYATVKWSLVLASKRYSKAAEVANDVYEFMDFREIFCPTVKEWGGNGSLSLQWIMETRSIVLYFKPNSTEIFYAVGRVGEATETKKVGDLFTLLDGLAKWLSPPTPVIPLTEEERRRGSSCGIRGRDRSGSIR